ncbi:MAG TPA: hypothetical protein DCM54_15515 [Gammaproteobacteria bacterium]|nr:hypothetical protein [Gammaproteobacteria bacterium]|tara:strand:+ start:817 stop:1668 length:852 start_codon:yes stop_codon:yes gene_type:complete
MLNGKVYGMSSAPKWIESQIAFVNEEWRQRSEPPRIFNRESRHANTSRHDVVIHNARLQEEEYDLDDCGYILVNHKTAVSEFRNKEVVAQQYFPEMQEVILELTGAHTALPFSFYQVRSKRPDNFFDAYSLYMHCDFSPDTWLQLAQSIVQTSGTEEQYPEDEWDFALYNLWRPIERPVEKDPLVLIDARTIEREDIVNYLAIEEGTNALAAIPLFNKNQKYCYFPNMTPDEVLVFKQLDSRIDKSLVCPHTSFIDPSAAADAGERESIDIRFMCVFPKEKVN